jgi:hypothetical protein
MQRLLAGSVEPRTISIVVCESGNCSQNLRRHSMKLSVSGPCPKYLSAVDNATSWLFNVSSLKLGIICLFFSTVGRAV